MNETKRLPKRILVDFTGTLEWVMVYDFLAEDVAVIQWALPDWTIVRATAVALGDTHPETGEPIWTWDGEMTPVTEEQEA